jgi:TldD protein
MIRRLETLVVVILCLFACRLMGEDALPKEASDDPVLKAMVTEMQRSKAQLKLDGVSVPYYIDYRITDTDAYLYQAAFGATTAELRNHMRYIRVVVRVGDYKQDSFYQNGQGLVEVAGVDDDEFALRHKLWLATDQAYKAAAEALTAKNAALKQLTIEYPIDDFAHAEPVLLVKPLVKLDPAASSWSKVLKEVSAFYRNDPQLESVDTDLSFTATNRYFVNSEGTVVRTGGSIYLLLAAASTQAGDGMRLDRSADFAVGDFKDLPTPAKFKQHAEEVMGALRQLRDAPVVEEEYRGPILFQGDAATHVVADLIGENVLGRKPALGQPLRTRGAFASSYLSRVLPDFLSVDDDPTISAWQGEQLLGNYEVDDDGVKATKVSLIDKGKLVGYDLGREPIRDFPASNGHGRAPYPMNPSGPNLGNLILRSSEPLSEDALKAKLMELCKQRDLAYCYVVKTTGPKNSPRLLYKVFVNDGHEQLVRGATFGDLDTRTMRNDIVAAGEKASIENLPTAIPHSIVSPSLLFDELEVKRVDQNKEKLPEYPAPQLGK